MTADANQNDNQRKDEVKALPTIAAMETMKDDEIAEVPKKGLFEESSTQEEVTEDPTVGEGSTTNETRAANTRPGAVAIAGLSRR